MKIWMILITMFSAQGGAALEKSQVLDIHGLSNLVDGPSGLNRSMVTPPTYVDLEARLRHLVNRHPTGAQLIQYGLTVEGRNLNMVRIAHAGVRAKTRQAVQISGAIHGNEYLGIEEKLVENFLDRQNHMPGLTAFLQKGGVVYFIPVVNPDGFSRSQRLNRNGSDLNRDFDLLPRSDVRFSQPETRSLAEYLDADMSKVGAKLKLSLDYHCCVPALITPWAYIDAQPEPSDHSTFLALADMQRSTLGYETGNAAQTVGYLAEGSSIDYFYAKYGTLALAIEGQWWGEEAQLPKHIAFWERMFQELASAPRRAPSP